MIFQLWQCGSNIQYQRIVYIQSFEVQYRIFVNDINQDFHNSVLEILLVFCAVWLPWLTMFSTSSDVR